MKIYKISEFSKLSGLTPKALRYYDEVGILRPVHRSTTTKYRYYDELSFQRAREILILRQMDFTIEEIKKIVQQCKDDKDLQKYINTRMAEIQQDMERFNRIYNRLNSYKKYETKAKIQAKPVIIEGTIKDIRVATIRFHGQYDQEPEYFLKLVQIAGKHFIGGSMSMVHGKGKDGTYDIELAAPVSKPINEGPVKSRILKGGKTLSLQHKGSYETIKNSYKILTDYMKENNLELQSPPQELAIKGIWTIIPRNPKSFVTEIRCIVKPTK